MTQQDALFAAVDVLRGDMISVPSEVTSIPSVNDDVVGAAGTVSRLLAEIYQDGGADVETWEVEPKRTPRSVTAPAICGSRTPTTSTS